MMDHEQVRKLRADLGISQAVLARASGINRTVLSGFETGQLILQGDVARRLADFFASRGVDIDQAAADTRKISERNQALLAELQWVEQRIQDLERADCEKGFFDAFFERYREEREELLIYLARWRVLVLMLQGETVPHPPVDGKAVTQADFLALEYLKLRKKAADGAN